MILSFLKDGAVMCQFAFFVFFISIYVFAGIIGSRVTPLLAARIEKGIELLY